MIAASSRGGDVRISTGSLSLRNGAQIDASTNGSGDSGSVIIEARDRIDLNNSIVFSRSGGDFGNGRVILASGRGGDVRISTSSLSVRNGAQLNASTFGRGNAGSVLIEARDRVEFQEVTVLSSRVVPTVVQVDSLVMDK